MHDSRPGLGNPALAQANAAGGRLAYRPDIDGLRAIAVTSVVLFHAGLIPFSSGFVGVDIFFVISGYLIGGIILREAANNAFSFLRFYARRVRRILPALFVVVLSTCVAGWFLLPPADFKDVGVIGALALLGASNINFWQFQNYFGGDAHFRVLLMTWSLGVEEQFYLVFPILILASMRFARGYLVAILGLLSILSFGLSLWWTKASPVSAFYLLPARAWELGIGAILAAVDCGLVRVRSRGLGLPPRYQDILAAGGLLALTVSVVGFDDHTPFPGTLVLLPVLGTMALITSKQSWINLHLLSARPMAFVGLVSYSWYLWHWPLMSLLRNVLPEPPPTLVLAGVAAVSFGLAILSWWFVERPFRRTRLGPRAVLLRYAAASALVIAVPASIAMSNGVPSRLSPGAMRIHAVARELEGNKCLVMGSALSDNAACTSRVDGRPVVALLGDSHAWALGDTLRALAADQGLGYELFAKASCTPVLGVKVRLPPFHDLPETCVAFKAAAVRKIVDDPQVTTVVLAGFWFPPTEIGQDQGFLAEGGVEAETSGLSLLRDGLARMLDVLVAAHKHVIIVEDVPVWTFDPLRIAFDVSMPLRRVVANVFDPNIARLESGQVPASRVARHDDVTDVINAVARKYPQVRVVDPYPRFCDARRCLFGIDNKPLYVDHDHLSPLGAMLALGGLTLADPTSKPH